MISTTSRAYVRKKAPLEVPSSISYSFQSPILDFKDIYEEYFFHCTFKGTEKYKDIFNKRVVQGIILEDIGGIYGLSRERIRQITEKVKNNFYLLFSGDSLKHPCIKLNMSYIYRMQKFENHLKTKAIHIRENIHQYLDYNYPKHDQESLEDYLSILMFILGYERVTLDEKEIFVRGDVVSNVQEYGKMAKDTLQESVLPIDIWEITKRTKIDSDILSSLLPVLDCVEILNDNTYQLKGPYSSSIMDVIYRVMKKEGLPLTQEEIQDRLTKEGITSNAKYLGNRFCSDKRFCVVGKKSTYALSEWKVDTRNYKEIIKDTLKKIGKPIRATDLSDLTSIPLNTITSYIHLYPEEFKRFGFFKLGLSGWDGHQSSEKRYRAPTITQNDFNQDMLKFILSKKDRRCLSTEFSDYYSVLNPGVKYSKVYAKIERCPFITIKRNFVNELCLRSDYRQIVKECNDKLKDKKSKSIQGVIKEAEKILSRRGSMLMTDLVKKLLEFDVPRPTIYRALDIGPFVKEPLEDDLERRSKKISLETA